MTAGRSFHRDIEALVARVVEMAKLSRRSVTEGVDAFVALDTEKAQGIIQLNKQINELDVEIEGRALALIALHQPMAVDLRTLGACIKIITYLDRIGRYGYDCAKATLYMENKPHIKRLVAIPMMRDKALHLLDMAMESFQTRNHELARKVEPMDDEVDAMYEQIVRECLTYMIEEPRTISQCTNYILVARHIERVGDNAAKIAEKTIYMCTGKNRLETAQV
jgi:phosphate transport system protein